jgi:hypothetical protein
MLTCAGALAVDERMVILYAGKAIRLPWPAPRITCRSRGVCVAFFRGHRHYSTFLRKGQCACTWKPRYLKAQIDIRSPHGPAPRAAIRPTPAQLAEMGVPLDPVDDDHPL